MAASHRSFPLWVPYAVAATVVLLDFLGSYVSTMMRPDRDYSWWFTGVPILIGPFAWAVASPALHTLYRRVVRATSPWKVRGPSIAALVVMIAALHTAVVAGVFLSKYGIEDPAGFASLVEHFVPTIVVWWLRDALQLLVIIGAFVGIDLAARLRDERVAMVRMERQLAEARLSALRSQLHPHFLFNALHTVGSLMERNVEEAQGVLTRLASLLRRMLEADREPCVTLAEELDMLRDYLDIEQVRFRDRLSVDYAIDPAAERALVPQLVMQPLVENAIKHGFATSAREGRVQLAARIDGEAIELRVADDGGGADPTELAERGIGLSNTRERLERLYGDSGHMQVDTAPGEGFVVRLRFPLEWGDAASEARA